MITVRDLEMKGCMDGCTDGCRINKWIDEYLGIAIEKCKLLDTYMDIRVSAKHHVECR